MTGGCVGIGCAGTKGRREGRKAVVKSLGHSRRCAFGTHESVSGGRKSRGRSDDWPTVKVRPITVLPAVASSGSREEGLKRVQNL